MSKQNIMYLYPQNSCPCSDICVPPGDPLAPIYTNNMEKNIPSGGVLHKPPSFCNVPQQFKNCENRIEYSKSGKNMGALFGFNLMNPEVYTEKYSKDFGAVANEEKTGCPGVSYRTPDPRTFDSPRAQWLSFDKPPINGTIKLDQVYDERLRGYGKITGGYDSIKDGQIMYYVGKDREDAYFRPIFSSNAPVTTYMYKTPMDGTTPKYTRGFEKWVNPTTTTPNCGMYCGNYMHDENFHRQELFSSYEASQQNRMFRARGSSNGGRFGGA